MKWCKHNYRLFPLFLLLVEFTDVFFSHSMFSLSSEDSYCYEAAEDFKRDITPADVVECDLAQSIDNIDRILQNIDEESEECGTAIKRNLSCESESSGDFSGTSISGFRSKRLNTKRADKTNLSVTPSMEHRTVSAEDNLNRQSSSNVSTISLCKGANNNKIASNVRSCSTSSISSAHKDIAVSTSVPVISQCPLSMTSKRLLEEKRDSAGSETSSAAEEALTDPIEKRKKLKSTLIKRARSVAVFSLKLKEKRAKSESKETEKRKDKVNPRNENIMVGGELSCVPIEMLISMSDVKMATPKKNSGQSLKTGTLSLSSK